MERRKAKWGRPRNMIFPFLRVDPIRLIKTIFILTIVTSLMSLLLANDAQVEAAVGKKWLPRFGLRLQELSRRVYDPWTVLAKDRGVAKWVQATQHNRNMIVMPLWRYSGNGLPLQALRSELLSLKDAGVQTIYLPPLQEQMLYAFYDSKNDHGYWPRSFDVRNVDPKLGTIEDLRNLVHDAKALEFELAIDLVPRHVGYPPEGGEIELWGRKLNTKDATYFMQTPEPTATDWLAAEKGPENLHIMTDYRIWGLPNFNFENEWVRKNVIKDSLQAVRMGFTTFRIDSAKHMRSDFLRELMFEISKEVRSHGHEPRFILEYFSAQYGEIAYKLSELENISGMYFIDFRISGAIREALNSSGDFRTISNAIMDLKNVGLDQSFLVPAITDQDGYYPPTYHGDPITESLTYANLLITNMVSTNRPYSVAGLEQSVPHGTGTSRPSVFWDKGSPVAGNLSYLNGIMNREFPRLRPFDSTDIIRSDKNVLVVSRTIQETGEKLVLLVDRNTNSTSAQEMLSKSPSGRQLFEWGRWGQGVLVTLLSIR